MLRTPARLAAAAAVFLSASSCQTIVEDLPSNIQTTSSAPAPVVILVLPEPTATAVPATPTASPAATAPPATPTSTPAGDPNCPGWPSNCAPVASIHAHAYYALCHGVAVDVKYKNEGPAGCDVRLDATPKDEKGKHTQARGTPEWTIDGSTIVITDNPFTPLVRAVNGGFSARVRVDGVWSNTVDYTFR
jgi:hypothetical protein